MATGWTGTDPAAWSGKSAERLTALLRNSVQELAVAASKTVNEGGRVPHKTGNLSRSVIVDTKEPQRDADGVKHEAPQDFSLGVANIDPGDTVWIGWQAIYSARMNYGFVGEDSLGRTYNFSGFGFAEAAAAQWPAIVAAEAAKLGGK
jgi:hypothetical protein